MLILLATFARGKGTEQSQFIVQNTTHGPWIFPMEYPEPAAKVKHETVPQKHAERNKKHGHLSIDSMEAWKAKYNKEQHKATSKPAKY